MADAEPPPLESVVLVPVLDAGQLVRDLRMDYDPSAAAGIPAHVTLMFPFTSPADLTEPIIETLEGLVSSAKAFEFSLTRVGQFEQGVVYLEPEPAAPFARLTKNIGRQFGLLPYGGAFGDNPVTHLTVAMLDFPLNRQDLVTKLGTQLPIRIRAEEAVPRRPVRLWSPPQAEESGTTRCAPCNVASPVSSVTNSELHS